MTVLLKEVLAALAQQEHKKKMSKTVAEESDVCHKFVEKVRLMSSPKQRKFVDISHNVSCSNFVIFISYDHKNVHVKTFISDILEEAIKSELSRFGWKVHQPLVEEKKSVHSLLEHQVDIIFTAG